MENKVKERQVLSEKEFVDFFQSRANSLLLVFTGITQKFEKNHAVSRLVLGKIISESLKLEEMLDAFGAKENQNWYSFRRAIAAAKIFSRLLYIFSHLYSATPHYKLLKVDGDFTVDTYDVMINLSGVIKNIATHVLELAQERNLQIKDDGCAFQCTGDIWLHGKLEADRKMRKCQDVAKTAIYLASTFLKEADESKLSNIQASVGDDYSSAIPDILGESMVRDLCSHFHNLQSLYDTNIADSDIEIKDPDLPILRGHISIVFHLLEALDEMVHYYERHLVNVDLSSKQYISQDLLLQIIWHYTIHYSVFYLEAGMDHCRHIIAKYAENSEVVVSVPVYRGFHVRPSTLLAKIAHHYGSSLILVLNDQEYNAASPMALFRVNEAINAIKRKRLAEYVVNLDLLQDIDSKDMEGPWLRTLVLKLMEDGKIVLYDHEMEESTLKPFPGETITEYARRYISRLLASGKIDIKGDIKVIFKGDKRVLYDIELLAAVGYGEDERGNNVMLPEEISYLR